MKKTVSFNEENDKKGYVAPQIEEVNIIVERGFAASENTAPDGGGDDLP